MAFQAFVLNGDLNESGNNNGYQLITTLKTNIKQNLKMLVLTSPGECIGDPDFGVGIKKYLFEMNDNQVYSMIESAIRKQVKKHLPYIVITRVLFQSFNENPNGIKLSLEYTIPRISLNDALEMLL